MERTDPRVFQIAILAGLLAYGTARLGFDVTPSRIALVLTTALAGQYACVRIWSVPRFDPRSALVSGLSLCLLLRTNDPAIAVAAILVAIASKFLIRVDGRHVFNPTNLGLIVALLLTDRAWVSPGQWGQLAFFAVLLASLGAMVVHRAKRSDVTLAFLAIYAGIVVSRGLWLGDPPAIALHHLQSGSLLLFSFFMISDPKTTPDTRAGRVVFALLVATCAAYLQFVLYSPNGLILALAICAPAVPALNWSLTVRANLLARRKATSSARQKRVPLSEAGTPLTSS